MFYLYVLSLLLITSVLDKPRRGFSQPAAQPPAHCQSHGDIAMTGASHVKNLHDGVHLHKTINTNRPRVHPGLHSSPHDLLSPSSGSRAVALPGPSPPERRGFVCSWNNSSHCKGCWGKGYMLPALHVCLGPRFLDTLFLCRPFQVKNTGFAISPLCASTVKD